MSTSFISLDISSAKDQFLSRKEKAEKHGMLECQLSIFFVFVFFTYGFARFRNVGLRSVECPSHGELALIFIRVFFGRVLSLRFILLSVKLMRMKEGIGITDIIIMVIQPVNHTIHLSIYSNELQLYEHHEAKSFTRQNKTVPNNEKTQRGPKEFV